MALISNNRCAHYYHTFNKIKQFQINNFEIKNLHLEKGPYSLNLSDGNINYKSIPFYYIYDAYFSTAAIRFSELFNLVKESRHLDYYNQLVTKSFQKNWPLQVPLWDFDTQNKDYQKIDGIKIEQKSYKPTEQVAFGGKTYKVFDKDIADAFMAYANDIELKFKSTNDHKVKIIGFRKLKTEINELTQVEKIKQGHILSYEIKGDKTVIVFEIRDENRQIKTVVMETTISEFDTYKSLLLTSMSLNLPIDLEIIKEEIRETSEKKPRIKNLKVGYFVPKEASNEFSYNIEDGQIEFLGASISEYGGIVSLQVNGQIQNVHVEHPSRHYDMIPSIILSLMEK